MKAATAVLVSMILLLCPAASLLPCASAGGWERFQVKRDLIPGRKPVLPKGDAVLPVVSLAEMDTTPETGVGSVDAPPPAAARSSQTGPRLGVSLSRYEDTRVIGEDGLPVDLSGAPAILDSLAPVLRGEFGGRDALETIGGVLRPQLNVQVEF